MGKKKKVAKRQAYWFKKQAEAAGKRREIEGGIPCPKCSEPMQRVEHNERWVPKKDQPFYFRYWDKCVPCRHIQHYESAKVMLDKPDDPLTDEYREIMRGEIK